MTVAQEKLQQLVQGGIGAKQSHIEYVEGSIFQSFASVSHQSINTLFLDTNPDLDPVTAIQRATMQRWSNELKDVIAAPAEARELGTMVEVPVNTKPHSKSKLRPVQGMLVLGFIHEPSKLEGDKRVWEKPSGRLELANRFLSAMSQLLDAAINQPARYGNIGMPTIGNNKTWSNIESALEDLCDEKGYLGKIIVFKQTRRKR
jgi:hypothetical protein